MAYMYRSPFAAGNVFSASMIDALLYQAFGKPYLIELIRLLIGLNQKEGSGNLTSVCFYKNKIKKFFKDLF
jgi:potassium channel subfamily T protein 1